MKQQPPSTPETVGHYKKITNMSFPSVPTSTSIYTKIILLMHMLCKSNMHTLKCLLEVA